MNTKSPHLERILDTEQGVTPMQVVFVDIEKYSKRTSSSQKNVIDKFSTCLQRALTETAKHFIEYIQKAKLNLNTDVVTLPLGDGAAIVFPFSGPNNFHLCFAETLLSIITEMNSSEACDIFLRDGWCNCHSKFNLRIGISSGDGIIYKDVNKQFNVAGTVINEASRVMNHANPNSILVSTNAYQRIIELSTDGSIIKQFGKGQDITVKHGINLTVYELKGDDKSVDEASEPSVVFKDDFETPTEWPNFGRGSVIYSSDYSRSGNYSLKKDANTDPHGGYKTISKPISRGFIFSGWIYRPLDGGKNADRLAVEDSEYNGYGFYVEHRRGLLRIERRDNGRDAKIVDPIIIDLQKVTDCWYQFLFQVKTDSTLDLHIKSDTGDQLASMTATDTKYATFDRVVVHGGYTYYIDDIKIEMLS